MNYKPDIFMMSGYDFIVWRTVDYYNLLITTFGSEKFEASKNSKTCKPEVQIQLIRKKI